MKKMKIVLELDAAAVLKIEKLVEQDIKTLLEDEVNNVDAFIDVMGYDN
jgi:5-bromo-4-chloroindolyl phosphate hydrolysis protein